jgi:hypothetical protein
LSVLTWTLVGLNTSYAPNSKLCRRTFRGQWRVLSLEVSGSSVLGFCAGRSLCALDSRELIGMIKLFMFFAVVWVCVCVFVCVLCVCVLWVCVRVPCVVLCVCMCVCVCVCVYTTEVDVLGCCGSGCTLVTDHL